MTGVLLTDARFLATALIFVLSTGIAFYNKHKDHTPLRALVILIAITSTLTLIYQIYTDVAERFHKPATPPQAVASDGFMAGKDAAKLYDRYAWCYDYNPSEGSCSRNELLAAKSGNQIQIVSEIVTPLQKNSPDSVGEFVFDALTSGTKINPDGLRVIEIQTLDVTPQGLCRSKAQSMRDAYQTDYRFISKFGEGAEETDVPPEDRDWRRQRKAESLSSTLEGTICWRYAFRPSSSDTLRAVEFLDQIQQPRKEDTIRLLDNSQTIRLRP